MTCKTQIMKLSYLPLIGFYEKLTESSTEFTGNPQKSQKSKEDLRLNKLILPSGHSNRIFSPYLDFCTKLITKLNLVFCKLIKK